MKKVHVLWVLACLLAAPVLFQSCSDDDDEVYVWYPYLSPNALVTVKGGTDSCFLQFYGRRWGKAFLYACGLCKLDGQHSDEKNGSGFCFGERFAVWE